MEYEGFASEGLRFAVANVEVDRSANKKKAAGFSLSLGPISE